MVDVGEKPITKRVAKASAVVRMSSPTLVALVRDRTLSKKGDVLEVARLAGIMAAKRTSELIPLCHPLALDGVTIDFEFEEGVPVVDQREPPVASGQNPGARQHLAPATQAAIRIEAEVHCTGRTGVEMEALTAASVAALTIYDMCKSAERGMLIEQVRLEEKSGGRSGNWTREA